ncbi:MAG: hypothetical protein QF662_06000, partial [Phycisphaerae bacterium]|nr:hypothetical protein [Phycisphaerae bacterium]
MKVADKVRLSFLVIAMVITGLVGLVAYTKSKSDLEEATIERLKTMARSRARNIVSYVKTLETRIALMADSAAL